MNRYPLWKYAILLIAFVVGVVYTLPNLFGEAPAVQVSSGKVTVKIDPRSRRASRRSSPRPGSRPTSSSTTATP